MSKLAAVISHGEREFGSVFSLVMSFLIYKYNFFFLVQWSLSVVQGVILVISTMRTNKYVCNNSVFTIIFILLSFFMYYGPNFKSINVGLSQAVKTKPVITHF